MYRNLKVGYLKNKIFGPRHYYELQFTIFFYKTNKKKQLNT